eukprot:9841414-Karenia_brevis.AAC.1
MHWRCQRWQVENKKLHHSNPTKVLHKVSGAQKAQWESLVFSFACSLGWKHWWEFAVCRKAWKEHEEVFSNFARLELNI